MQIAILVLCSIAGYILAQPIIHALRVSQLSPYQQRKLDRMARQASFKKLASKYSR